MIGRTASPAETLSLGRALGEILKIGDIVLLIGPLGAGKTLLVKGIAEGMAIDDPGQVVSPSFSIINIYDGPNSLYHIDLYRLEDGGAMATAGLEDFLPGEGVTVVEWGEKLPDPPAGAYRVTLSITGPDSRQFDIDPVPPGFEFSF